MSYKPPISEPIAVVGTSCRFAGGVTTPSRLWQLLANPTDLTREVPAERFNIKAFYHPDGEYHGTTNSPKAYFLDQDHRVFDSSFFNISPKEAEAIDPQQRMMLEVVYEALESAGYGLRQYAGDKVAVFAGLMTGDYDTLSQRDELDMSQYYATGNARSILSNRISYFFDFRGPSMTIDTACSSSLVALHQAVLGLRSGECKMACVAGANLILTPEQFVVESNLHMLSPAGHSRMWDASANGYARGEGIAAMFIKPLSQALADGDRIEAVIRETGVNSDGRSRGITMPNWEAQSRLIQDTYQRAGLDPGNPEDRCQYFEAHGTGTSAGDPNEARAIEDAFFGRSKQCNPGDKLLVGSVKTVIGHTEGAAGLAGLLKVVQSMRHSTVPPNLHLEKLNPEVEQYYNSLLVPTTAIAWPHAPTGQPKRGSINSFGFGGTNAHAIVEQYMPEVHGLVAKTSHSTLELPLKFAPLSTRSDNNQICIPLVLSASSRKSLAAVVKTYRDYVTQGSFTRSEELAWHTFARRSAFPIRLSVSSLSVSGLVDKLNSIVAQTEESSTVSIGTRARPRNEQPRILGVFTGQGAQWATMSRGLLCSSQVYAATIRSLDNILRTCPDPPSWSLEQEIMADESLSRVQKASVSQPLCTAVQLALVDLLRHLGISFHTVLGHSSGEIAAAYAAGRITMRDAILISHYRGMGVHMACGANGKEGGMLAVGLTREDATEFCASKKYANRLWVAASNGPSSVTLSGDLDAVQQARDDLTEQQKFARVLFVDKAYHSPHMERVSAEYLETLKACEIEPAEGNGTTWISSVYGWGEAPTAELAATYWKDNMVRPVLFFEAVSTALKTLGPFDCAIEVGPHPALKGPVSQTMKRRSISSFPYLGLLDRKLDDREAFANFLGSMWTHFGSSTSHVRQFVLGSVQPELVDTRLTDVPSYPWDHSQKFYRESRVSRQYHFKSDKPHELLGVRTRDDNKHQLRWRNILKYEKLCWVKHHSFQGQALLPASAYLVMALDAARVSLAGRPAAVVELRDLKFLSGITLEQNTPGVEVLFALTLEQDGQNSIEGSFTLTSAVADGRSDMRKNFSGNLTITIGQASATALPPRPKERAETLHASPEAFYDMMAATGLVYSSPFKGLQTLERRYNFSSGTLKKYHDEDTTELTISSATLDSCLQTAFVTISSPGDNAIWTSFLPLNIECVRFNMATCETKDRATDSLAVDAYMTKATPFTRQNPASFTADIEIFNPQGDMEIQVQGLTVGSFSSTKPENDYELYLTTKFDIDPDDEIVSVEVDEVHEINPTLIESCERVAAFYSKQAPISRSSSSSRLSTASQTETLAIVNSWPKETEESLDSFVRASPYFVTLDFIRQLGQDLPEVVMGMLPAVIEEAHQLVGFQQHVSRVVCQIAHKYPRMSVLGSTDPELGLTEHILNGLGEVFVSYRLGSEPEKNLEHRMLSNDSLRRKIMVDKVDLGAAQSEQGQSYDLVVLATSLIESQKTAAVLTAVKDMMRPGGFLILIDVSRTPLKDRIRRCAGMATSNQPLSPPDWPDLLDQCGFEYSMKNGHQYYPPGFSLIVRQAESPEKSLLLHPFVKPITSRLADSLLVVGGKKPCTTLLSAGVSSALANSCGEVEVAETLESLHLDFVSTVSAVIILSDLDEPVLATMTAKRMEVLRALFRPEMTILWVTHNARFHDPDHAASFGFARTLAAETPGLLLQMLDLDTMDIATVVEAITETFARLTKHSLVNGVHDDKPLWVTEPEVYLENGHRLVPRVLPWKEGNDRVNAPRRVVSNRVNTLEKVVGVVPCNLEDGWGRYAVEVKELDTLKEAPGWVSMQVDYSTVEAVNIGRTSSHICVGRNMETGKTQVAVSDSNASYIAVPSQSAVSIESAASDQPAFLAHLVRYLAALNIASSANGQAILLVEADRLFYECAQEILRNTGSRLSACSTDVARFATTPGMVYLHQSSPLREVKALYPPGNVWVIDLSAESGKLSEMFVQTLPKNCKYTRYSSLLGSYPLSNNGDNALFPPFWKQAVTLTLTKVGAWRADDDSSLIAVPELVQPNARTQPFQTVDWKAERSVSQIVKPLAGTQLLHPAKTYVLVGLTRDFGQSLCTLFVQQGARHIVLCSRNPPTTQPKWQTEMLRKGITVCFEALDVTSLEQVVAFKTKLAETLPPVGGVVNGAMVLEDRVFSQMSLETLQRVMRPKTVGSKNLDFVFDSADMDFFIMTSSFAAVGGHAAQSNYAAANMYMNGLAASRRRRGLPGSVLNIGVIYGLGFLHREKDDLYHGLEREGYPPISERDIHHMFVEAIAAGKPTPDQIYDITTGLRRFPADDPRLHWHHDPRFSHFTTREEGTDAAGAGSSSQEKQQSLKELLEAAATKTEIVDVLVQGFIDRLQSQLQLGEGSVTGEHNIADLGVDSLAAVEVRAWAWKALGQDLAVMKILGGATIVQLCKEMAGGIMASRAAGPAGAVGSVAAPATKEQATQQAVVEIARTRSSATAVVDPPVSIMLSRASDASTVVSDATALFSPGSPVSMMATGSSAQSDGALHSPALEKRGMDGVE